MVLVDTSVWIDHLRRGNDDLVTLLEEARSLCHPFIIGELACGNLSQRDSVLSLLGALQEAPVAEHTEVLELVESRRLQGRGLGWIDLHLLAAALLAGCSLWTLDRRLAAAARELGAGP